MGKPMTDTPIVRLPAYEPEDEWCCVCRDDNIAFVIDRENVAPYQRTHAVFCYKCGNQMVREAIKILGITYETVKADD